MANLRANTIAGSGGSGNNTKASLYFDGSNEYLSFADNADFAMGTGDLTAECWFYVESNVDYRSIIDARDAAGDADGWMIGVKADGNVYVYAAGWLLITTSAEGTINTWHHVAYVRKDGTHTLYLDGVSKATSTTSKDYTTQKFAIGTLPYSLGNDDFKGYISSVNLVKGTALYTGNFDPYEVSPKVLSDTVLLCCNDSQKPEAYEVSPGVITPGGTPTPSTFIPSNLAVPTGVVFDGPIKINTENVMYFPTGDTSQRGRGRGLFGGGVSPAGTTLIEYIQIQSTGNSTDFGSLTRAATLLATCSSSTRGLWGGDYPSAANTIDYVTIATTGNALDFGDLTDARYNFSGCGSETRGLFGGGHDPSVIDVIDYVTIATTGNATDFGNLLAGCNGVSSASSPTRGLWFGGDTGSKQNVIQYVTIATTGNATDFGDMQETKHNTGALSSQTRALVAGGNTGSIVDTIDYVEIATTGNGVDFGNLTAARQGAGTASNSRRGVFASGLTPSSTNTMDYVTIETTGNATDYGDLDSTITHFPEGLSDSHGGLS